MCALNNVYAQAALQTQAFLPLCSLRSSVLCLRAAWFRTSVLVHLFTCLFTYLCLMFVYLCLVLAYLCACVPLCLCTSLRASLRTSVLC